MRCTVFALYQKCNYTATSPASNQNGYSHMYNVPIFSAIGEPVGVPMRIITKNDYC